MTPPIMPGPLATDMTLRDYFAGQLAAQELDRMIENKNDFDASIKFAAHRAYRMADAMLAARDRDVG